MRQEHKAILVFCPDLDDKSSHIKLEGWIYMAVHHLYFLYSFRLVGSLGKGALLYRLFGRGGIILMERVS